MTITVGSTIKDGKGNSYILDSVLGSGGFGNVYKAHRENDDANFAVKTLLSSFESPESLLSFQNELHETLLISSEHVIKYIYAHDGNMYPEYPPYIIMEYADGTLTSLIENQKKTGVQFENAFLLKVFIQLAEGMREISRILIHRDIKPDNILICNGKMKISDFGLSKLAGENTRTLTFKGYGSTRYVAPEAWSNDKNTIQMDIYSMGIVFYELATMRYPYSVGASADFLTLRNAHMFEAPRNPQSINAGLSSNIVSIIVRMIEKPIQKRFTTWESIINALQAQALPTDDLSVVVIKAMKNRNEADLAAQQQLAQKKKQEEEKDNFCRLIYSQYDCSVLEPIREFIERFNTQYAGMMPLRLKPDGGYPGSYRFTNTIITPSNDKIQLDTEIIFKENYQHKISNWLMGNDGYRIENYIPQCEKRDILAWSQVSDKIGRGFNLILLKAEGSLYGDWFLLTNTNSGFSRSPRVEPFGFTLNELPKEIVNLHVTHIYNLNLSLLKSADIPDFLSEHV